MKLSHCFYLTFLFLFSTIMPAAAYIGPGAGIGMLGSLYTLIGGIVLALVMVLFYPVRLMIKRMKRKKSDS